MATSTNYGWSEPDNSSLVKDGAQAMRTLGDAIDTSLWNVGYGQAGKNKIINGDFGIWQRGTSGFGFGAAYNADRWAFYRDGSGATEAITQQTFTAGTAPVAGYESQYFWRYAATVAGTGATERSFYQRIENVRTFANQTVTVSFWAKADAARTVSVALTQNFGSGGSASVTTALTSQSLTTSWARYSASVAVPSISGKTVGTSSYLQLVLGFPVNVIETIDIWGVQVEYGSKATPFQTASGGDPQSELAMCQRYYQRWSSTQFNRAGFVYADSTTNAVFVDKLPVCLRGTPTLTFTNMTANGNAITAAAVVYILDTANSVFCNLTTSGVSANTVYQLYVAASQTGVIAYSSEL